MSRFRVPEFPREGSLRVWTEVQRRPRSPSVDRRQSPDPKYGLGPFLKGRRVGSRSSPDDSSWESCGNPFVRTSWTTHLGSVIFRPDPKITTFLFRGLELLKCPIVPLPACSLRVVVSLTRSPPCILYIYCISSPLRHPVRPFLRPFRSTRPFQQFLRLNLTLDLVLTLWHSNKPMSL